MNAKQEAAFLACAACDSSEEVSELRGEDNAEGSDLTHARGGPAVFNVLKDWCGSAQSLGAWAIDNSQRGWRDPLKCSWDQALQSILLGKASLHANHEFKARGVCEQAPMWRDNP